MSFIRHVSEKLVHRPQKKDQKTSDICFSSGWKVIGTITNTWAFYTQTMSIHTHANLFILNYVIYHVLDLVIIANIRRLLRLEIDIDRSYCTIYSLSGKGLKNNCLVCKQTSNLMTVNL